MPAKKRKSHPKRKTAQLQSVKKGGTRTAPRKKPVTRKVLARRIGILKKFEDNPIIEPDASRAWESKATFNPAALYAGGKIHILYRAIGDTDVSVLGYASSDEGGTAYAKSPLPAYPQGGSAQKNAADFTRPPLVYASGGGWNGGSEDPRLTLLGGTVYLLYTAFDGWASLRLALTSIPLDDFQNGRWTWKKPVFISPPNEIAKNWVIFPEKIRGKYAILHSISPSVLVDYFDTLDHFDGTRYIQSRHESSFVKSRWDSRVRGAGPPPIKTKDGWLLLYHATDHRDPGRYKLGAMLLDLKDPTHILYRSKEPILEPDEPYENEGFKGGVIYSCGAVAAHGTLFVYYGAADSVTGLATASIETFLKELKRTAAPKLKRARKM